MKTAVNKVNFSNLSGVPLRSFESEAPLQPEFSVPEIQKSTMQVPCGIYSIFDLSCHSLSEFARITYLVINEHSNWDTGISHALSYGRLAKLLGVKHKLQVIRAVKELIAAGFLKKKGRKNSTGENIYQVVHHNCPPGEVPLDKHGRPQKCAIPNGAGSPLTLLAEGLITWREAMFWIIRKIFSDWTSGTSNMTVREMNKHIRLSIKSICSIPKRLIEKGLLERLSANFRRTIFKLFPMPYPERRERAEYKGKRPLALIGNFYYSHNKRWRFHKETLRLMVKEEGTRKWRDASSTELYRANPAIHRDFTEYMDMCSSVDFAALKQSYALA